MQASEDEAPDLGGLARLQHLCLQGRNLSEQLLAQLLRLSTLATLDLGDTLYDGICHDFCHMHADSWKALLSLRSLRHFRSTWYSLVTLLLGFAPADCAVGWSMLLRLLHIQLCLPCCLPAACCRPEPPLNHRVIGPACVW